MRAWRVALTPAIALCIALIGPTFASVAQSISLVDTPLIVLDADNRYDVNVDGTYTQTYHFEFQPTNDAAARREAQQAIGYNPSLEDFSILDARITKPGGRVLVVQPADIHDQLPWSTPDLATFGDQRQKVIVFPKVAGGDTLSYTWRRTVKRAAFAGQFMTSIYMSRGNPWHALDLTVSVPATMHLQTEAHGMAEDETAEGDRIVYHWHASAPVADPTTAVVGPYDRLPRVFVSTFSGYDAFAHSYAALIAEKATPTPAIRALADRLTAGVTDRREQARILYDWVSLHVRYIAIYLNIGALEPRPAQAVLADGYGDCKDHTVLYHALLAAKGIAADLVMINLGNHYTLSGPPTFAQLNHAISYLPEFDVYADTTAGTAPFGTLPFDEYGKPAVYAVPTGHALHRIPVLTPEAASMELHTIAHLEPDGSITGTTLTIARGPFSIGLRRSALWAEANGAAGAAAMQLHALGTEGIGAFAFAPPNELHQSYEVSGSFELDPRPEILDGDSFIPPVGLRISARPGDQLLGPMGDRKLSANEPAPCFGGRQVEDVTLSLPAGRRVERLPPDRDIDNEILSYQSRWSVHGDTLHQRRELVSKISAPLCSGETRRIAALALDVIRRDEQRRVALAAPDTTPADLTGSAGIAGSGAVQRAAADQ